MAYGVVATSRDGYSSQHNTYIPEFSRSSWGESLHNWFGTRTPIDSKERQRRGSICAMVGDISSSLCRLHATARIKTFMPTHASVHETRRYARRVVQAPQVFIQQRNKLPPGSGTKGSQHMRDAGHTSTCIKRRDRRGVSSTCTRCPVLFHHNYGSTANSSSVPCQSNHHICFAEESAASVDSAVVLWLLLLIPCCD